MKTVKSHNILAVGYREEDETLRVQFTTGATYEYSGVPADAAKEFMEAKSVGSHFHKNIRGKWECKKLEEAAQEEKTTATETPQETREQWLAKLKERVRLRDQMGGALYWNMLNDECCQIANKCLDLGVDRSALNSILGVGTYR